MTSAATADTGGTTIMMRNLPKRYTAWDMVYELERFVARSSFDFVYVPWDRSSVTNMSCAFVNFTSGDVARQAIGLMDGTPWVGAPGRVAKIRPAHVQGLAVNLQRFQMQVASKGAVNADHAPLVFDRGTCIPWERALECLVAAERQRALAVQAQERPAYEAAMASHHAIGSTKTPVWASTSRLLIPNMVRPTIQAASDSDVGFGDDESYVTEDSLSVASGWPVYTVQHAAMGGSPSQVGAPGVRAQERVVHPTPGLRPGAPLTDAQIEGLAESKEQVKSLLLRLRHITFRDPGTGVHSDN